MIVFGVFEFVLYLFSFVFNFVYDKIKNKTQIREPWEGQIRQRSLKVPEVRNLFQASGSAQLAGVNVSGEVSSKARQCSVIKEASEERASRAVFSDHQRRVLATHHCRCFVLG